MCHSDRSVRTAETAGGNTAAVPHFYDGTTNAHTDAHSHPNLGLCP